MIRKYNDAPPIFRELLDALIEDCERSGFAVIEARLQIEGCGPTARMHFMCPCGNSLYFALAIDTEYLEICGRKYIDDLVPHARECGWSRQHIERDVQAGTLDPGALQRYDEAMARCSA